MEWNKENLKGLLLVICGGVAFYCALQNLPAVAAGCWAFWRPSCWEPPSPLS